MAARFKVSNKVKGKDRVDIGKTAIDTKSNMEEDKNFPDKQWDHETKENREISKRELAPPGPSKATNGTTHNKDGRGQKRDRSYEIWTDDDSEEPTYLRCQVHAPYKLQEHELYRNKNLKRPRARCRLCKNLTSYYCAKCSIPEKAIALCCGIKGRDCWGDHHRQK